MRVANGSVQNVKFGEYWGKIPDSFKIGGRALYFCYEAFGREYPSLAVIPMNYGGFRMLGPIARNELISRMKPIVLKALLYENFALFCNYLHANDVLIQDFLSDEDMEEAERNFLKNEEKVEDSEDGSIAVVRDEGTSLLIIYMNVDN